MYRMPLKISKELVMVVCLQGKEIGVGSGGWKESYILVCSMQIEFLNDN